MTGDAADRARWQHVKALLAQALELDDAAQRAFVDEVSAGDADLREDLVSLLAAQHAYEAAARVITTLDSVLDTLINRTGVTR